MQMKYTGSDCVIWKLDCVIWKFVGLFLSTTGIALGNPLIASKMKFVSLLKLLWPQVIELSTQYLLVRLTLNGFIHVQTGRGLSEKKKCKCNQPVNDYFLTSWKKTFFSCK